MTKPLFDMFREAQTRKPAASHREKLDWFIAKMKADPAYLDKLASEYFERMAVNYTVNKVKHGYAFGRTAVAESTIERRNITRQANAAVVDPAARRKQREESAARTDAAIAQMKSSLRRVVLLDLVMPNGQKLREATGAICLKAGNWYVEIGRRLKPSQVVDRHLSEADLQNIYARYFQRNSDDRKIA